MGGQYSFTDKKSVYRKAAPGVGGPLGKTKKAVDFRPGVTIERKGKEIWTPRLKTTPLWRGGGKGLDRAGIYPERKKGRKREDLH